LLDNLSKAFNDAIDLVENINIPFFSFRLRVHDRTEVIFRYIALGITIIACILWLLTGNEGTLYQLFFSKTEIGLGGIHWLVLVLMPFFYWMFSYYMSKHG